MAFPTIPTVAAGRVLSSTQADNGGTRTFPSLSGLTKNSGDLLIAICVVYQSSAAAGAVFSAWGAGFTEFLDVGGTTGNMSIGAAYKISTGSETGTFTVTQANTVTGHAAMFLLSIPGASLTTAPVGGTIVNATTSSANLAALNPATWDVNDTLWIAVAGNGRTAAGGTFTGFAGGLPLNYSNAVIAGVSAATGVGGVDAIVAFRQLAAASEDPGTFGMDVTNARNSGVLLAVRPATTQVTLTLVQETDSVQQIAAATTPHNLLPATETDAVGTIVPLQPLPATVTASAQPLSTQSGHNITTSTTTASVQALDVDKKVTITLAVETDSVPSTDKVAGVVTETDSARPLVITHASYSITLVTETDLAGDIVEFQPLPALVTETAQALSFTQGGRLLGVATTTASAQLLSFTQGGGYSISRATETDLANTIIPQQPLPAATTATALALDVIYGGKNIAPAQESDSARAVAPGAGINLPEWEATAPLPYNTKVAVGDVSTALALSKTLGVGGNKSILPATETDRAETRGLNLLPNGEFETDFNHWDAIGSAIAVQRPYSLEPSVPVLSGTGMCKITANVGGEGIIVEPDEWIAASPTTEYTLTAWFYAPVATPLNIAWNEYATPLNQSDSTVTGVVVPANTWTQITLTRTTSPVTTLIQPFIYLSFGGPQTFFVDSVSLTARPGGITVNKRVTLPLVTSTASVQALTKYKTLGITTATSTASALSLTFFQAGIHLTILPASSTDTVVSLSIFKQVFITLGIVTELDSARLTRAANRPTGGLALIDHEPGGALILIDHTENEDLALIDI